MVNWRDLLIRGRSHDCKGFYHDPSVFHCLGHSPAIPQTGKKERRPPRKPYPAGLHTLLFYTIRKNRQPGSDSGAFYRLHEMMVSAKLSHREHLSA